ncbi:hypothetical protein BS47DRAFT_1401037 [Hydnum rufescens UP504]|uniref:Uncharacterized protein n=1 Tax=Hydnum rufescens UP504 TaxID=1448309 RepID=A0A9P6AH17_9AGAM|nr:hypothetical protein BS47DRAFT_1401037 [Hydnum rufescens UP504]
MQATIEETHAHAAIVGRRYTELQTQVNAKKAAPEISRQSFATTAQVLNTTQALATIAAERAEEATKAQEKEQEKRNKVEKAEEARTAKAKKQYKRWVAAAVKIVNDRITQEDKRQKKQGWLRRAAEKAAEKEAKQHANAEATAQRKANKATGKTGLPQKRKRISNSDSKDKENGRADGSDGVSVSPSKRPHTL